MAKWATGSTTIVDLFANVDNLTPLQLLVLANLTEAQKNNFGLGTKITPATTMAYQLGNDYTTNAGIVIQSDSDTPAYNKIKTTNI